MDIKKIVPYCLVITISAILLGYNLGYHSMHLWDESRQANNALEMLESGNYLFPTYDGKPDFWNTKPHLLIVLQSLSFKLFGINLTALRLPSAIAGMATILLWFHFFYRRNRVMEAFTITAVLLCCNGFNVYHVARTGDYDALLVLTLSICIIQLYIFLFDGNRFKNIILFYVAFTFALLFKSVAAALWVPIFIIVLFTFKEKWNVPFLTLLRPAIIPFLAVVAYYGLHEMGTPGYISSVVSHEITGRYLQPNEGHNTFWYFYFDRLWNHEFKLFVVPFIISASTLLLPFKNKSDWKYFFIIAVSFIIIISISATRIEWYMAPAIPLLAACIAVFTGGEFTLVKHGKLFRAIVFLALISISVFEIWDQLENYQKSDMVNPSEVLRQSERQKKLVMKAKWLCGPYKPFELFYSKQLAKVGVTLRYQDSFKFQPGDTTLLYYNGYFDSLAKYNYGRLVHEPDAKIPMWVYVTDSIKR